MRPAGVRGSHNRGGALLRLRPKRQEGPAAGADNGEVVANLIEVSGADRVLTVDLHAGQIQGFFNIPMDELTADAMLARHFKERGIGDLVVVATDVGGGKHARNMARHLDTSMAIVEKMRAGNDDRVEAVNLIGEVEGRNALIVDDEIGTGGTVVATANALVEHGAKDIYCCATHAVYAGQAPRSWSRAPYGRSW